VVKKKLVAKSKKAGGRKNSLVVASPESCFWVCNGEVVRDLKELKTCVGNMSDDTYSYHVSKDRNDFVPWVYEILGDPKLAKRLFKIKDRSEAAKIIEEHIKKYYKA